MGMREVILVSRFPVIVAEADRRAAEIVDKTAHDIEAGAKTRVPVDTGNLKNSISVPPHEPQQAEVVASAEYAPYVEFGTSRSGAQPYMVPAAEEAMPGFEQAIRDLYR